jgi:SAM-dependent methyltransferase
MTDNTYCDYLHPNRFITEKDLPSNWEEINKNSWNSIASFWNTIIENEYLITANPAIDWLVSNLLKKINAKTVLELGVGDGTRLNGIRQLSGLDFKLIGTDLSQEMLDKAKRLGIETHLHDMRTVLPFKKESNDATVFLNGDFGYLMDKDPAEGRRMQIQALQSAYSVVKKGGILFCDFLSQDDPCKGTIRSYGRRMIMEGKPQAEKFEFFIKHFRFGEVRDLYKDAGIIPQASSSVSYIIRKGHSPVGETGDLVLTSNSDGIERGFEGIKNSDVAYLAKTTRAKKDTPGYRLLVTIQKPQ